MASSTTEPEIVRVSQKGQATIPKSLRESLDIDAPGEVFVYREGDRIVLEPVPSTDELRGIHASDREPGEVRDRVRAEREAEREHEAERADRLRPGEE